VLAVGPAVTAARAWQMASTSVKLAASLMMTTTTIMTTRRRMLGL